MFRPTPYGLEVFPRLTGILSAGHALKTHLEANGLSPDDMDDGAIDDFLDATPAGKKLIDIGRMLADVEMRAPDGQRVEFASIAFSDLMELKRLVGELDLDSAEELADLPPDAPRYVVSATLRDTSRAPRSKSLTRH